MNNHSKKEIIPEIFILPRHAGFAEPKSKYFHRHMERHSVEDILRHIPDKKENGYNANVRITPVLFGSGL